MNYFKTFGRPGFSVDEGNTFKNSFISIQFSAEKKGLCIPNQFLKLFSFRRNISKNTLQKKKILKIGRKFLPKKSLVSSQNYCHTFVN